MFLSLFVFACVEAFEIVNFSPTLTVTSPENGTVFNEGEVITIEGFVEDDLSRGGSIIYRWKSDKDGLIYEGFPEADGSISISSRGLSQGEHNTSIMVEDEGGLIDSQNIYLVVNGYPTKPEVELSPIAPNTKDDLSVRVRDSEDPEGASVIMKIEWFRNGVLVEDLTDLRTVSSEYTMKDEEWTVKVTPSDGIVDGISESTYVIIQGSDATIDNVSITPNEDVTTSTSLQCSAEVTDPDFEDVTVNYMWQIAIDGYFIDLTFEGESLSLSPDLVQPTDKIYCSAQTRGEKGDLEQSSTYVTVSNSLPVFSSAYVLPNVGVRSGTELSCYSEVTDPDFTDVTQTYRWSRNGELIALGQTLLLTDENASQGDTISCTVFAEDEHSGVSTMSADVEVINSAPMVDNIGINPANPTSQDSVQCTATVTDLDGDDVTLEYTWLINGVLQAETTAFLSESFQPNDVIECQVTPNDGYDTGDSENSTVTVVNSPPTIKIDAHR